MPIIRDTLSAMLGGAIPTSDERNLRRQSERLSEDARKANKRGGGGMVNLQALQTQLSYEMVKEQRYVGCGDMRQAQQCRVVIAALQAQLASYQPMAGMGMGGMGGMGMGAGMGIGHGWVWAWVWAWACSSSSSRT